MDPTRRDFIKTAAISAASLAASPGIIAESSAQTLPAPTADPLVIELANEALNAARSSGASYADRKSTRLNSSHSQISYAVFCLNYSTTTEIYTLSLHDALPIYGSHPTRLHQNRRHQRSFVGGIPRHNRRIVRSDTAGTDSGPFGHRTGE